MNRFSFLAIAALALTACTQVPEGYDGYVYSKPKVTTTSSTSSVQSECVNSKGVQLSDAECHARASQLDQGVSATAANNPNAVVTKTGQTCKTVNGVTSCVAH